MSLGDNKDQAGIPWIEKYRPSTLDDLIGHKHTIETSKYYFLISPSRKIS